MSDDRYSVLTRDELLELCRKHVPEEAMPPPLPACPCCKGESDKFLDDKWVWIQCIDCGLRTLRFDVNELGHEKARAVWARRPE